MNKKPASLSPWHPPFCSLSLCIQRGTACKWNPTIFALLQMFSSFIHVVACAKASIFLKQYCFTIFFIHSSVGGHLGCYYHLAVVNHAAVNVSVRVSVWVPACSSFHPVDHTVILGVACWGKPKLVSTVAVPVTLPSVMPSGSDFSLSSPQLTSSRWYLTVISVSISLRASDMEHLFICVLAVYMSLEKCLFFVHFWI